MSMEYKYDIDDSLSNLNKKLVCIEYPGLVNNVDKMLTTLGGIDNIGIAYSTPKRRIELRFRPDDIYCKPTCGDRQHTTALLLKVKVKKKTRDVNMPCSSRDADRPYITTFTTSIIGVVNTIYRFNSLCDFQYLPMDVKKGDTENRLENIYDRLRPNTLPNKQWLNEDNVPLFLLPAAFSRFDSSNYYNTQRVKDPNENSRTIGRTRKRRTGCAIFLSVKDEKVPQKPATEVLKMLHVKFLKDAHYETMKKLFEERPVWSKIALSYRTNFSKDQLKFLLPAVAYYFATGPWRVMWVRYGYDPRKIPEARIYQTFDFRMRTEVGLKNTIKIKRNSLPYKNTPAGKPKIAIISRHSIAKVYKTTNPSDKKTVVDENTYVFRPGIIPPFRQMFYQYCDVHVPEIQLMISKLPLPKPGDKIDLQSGWFPRGFDANCREIVSNLVTAEVRKKMLQQKRSKKKQQEEELEEMEEDYEEFEERVPNSKIEISDSEDSDSEIEMDLLTDSEEASDVVIDSDLEESLNV